MTKNSENAQSPEGDGNTGRSLRRLGEKTRRTLNPRKGTETLHESGKPQRANLGERSIPGRGRKQITGEDPPNLLLILGERSIPGRGRKLSTAAAAYPSLRSRRTLNPRKGTETEIQPTSRCQNTQSRRTLNPRKGTETEIQRTSRCQNTQSRRTLNPRKGTET